MNGFLLVHGVGKTLITLSGVSFLPFSDHTYQQAPYQDIDEKTV